MRSGDCGIRPSDNIPSKFLTYMQSGLPVLGTINAGNNLAALIREESVGQVCESNQLDDLVGLAEALLRQIDTDADLPARCKALFEQEFAIGRAVRQVVGALE